METARRADKLSGNANAITLAAQTPFEKILHIQLLRDLADIGIFSFE